jgi:hypothetical protein
MQYLRQPSFYRGPPLRFSGCSIRPAALFTVLPRRTPDRPAFLKVTESVVPLSVCNHQTLSTRNLESSWHLAVSLTDVAATLNRISGFPLITKNHPPKPHPAFLLSRMWPLVQQARVSSVIRFPHFLMIPGQFRCPATIAIANIFTIYRLMTIVPQRRQPLVTSAVPPAIASLYRRAKGGGLAFSKVRNSSDR